MRGGRIRTAVAVVAAIALTGCWGQWRGDAAHTGVQEYESKVGAPNVSDLAVTWRAGGVGSVGTVDLPPTVVYNLAFFGDRNGKVYAYDAAGDCVAAGTCARRWVATTPGSVVMSAPAVGDHRVFVGSGRKLYAFSAEGTTNCSGTPLTCTPLWSAGTGADIQSSPTLADGVVYVTSGGKVSAFDAAGVTNCTGSPVACAPLWTSTPGPGNGSSPAVAAGSLFVTTGDGLLAAIDATGTTNCKGTPKRCSPLWTAAIGTGARAGAAVRNGTVYVPAGGPGLLAFDASGTTNCSGTPKVCTPRWTGTAPHSDVEVAVTDTRVYTAGLDGTLRTFDAGGTTGCSGSPVVCAPLWSAATNESTAAPVVANGLVYLGSFDGYAYAFDAAGVTSCGGSPAVCRPLWAANVAAARGITVADGAVYTAALATTGVEAYQPCVNPVSFAGHAPCDLWNAYRTPSRSGGAGMTVGIAIAFHNPNAEADMAKYRNMFGLPGCSKVSGCFRQVNVDGETTDYPPSDPGWAVETSLDLQMVSAVCPYCKIVLVEAPPTRDGLPEAVDTAIALGADVVSNSYGTAEAADLADLEAHYDHPGVPIVVASGDDGYAAGPSFPATLATVTSVGGTSLVRAATPRGWAEAVWHEGFNTAITGSSCSQLSPKPAWQTDTGCAKRTDNDVAAVGERLAIYDSYFAPGWMRVSGTSASAPIIAAMYALAHGTNGASDLYAAAGTFYDVVEGTTGDCGGSYLCTAGVGYDAPTGVGTPCGVGAFGPAWPSPRGCGGAASGSAGLAASGFRATAPADVARPACGTPTVGGWRCLTYVER